MEFEWDEQKRIINLKKHKVDFVDVAEFWDSYRAIVIDERYNYKEKRYICYGLLRSRVMVLIYVERDEAIRVISFRKANRREVKKYESIIQKKI